MSRHAGLPPPNLPAAPPVYERRFHEQFSNVLRLYFTLVSNAVVAPVPHASYYDTTTQTNPVANAVNLFTYDSKVSEFSVRRGVPTSKIFVGERGMYNIQFSLQLDKTGGSASDVYIWLRQNGQNVPHTATKMVIDGPNNELVAAWNFLVLLDVQDYIELAWQSSDTNVVIAAAAASGNIPQIPSVIMTVWWVSNYAPGVE
jgi:hypothetical protein